MSLTNIIIILGIALVLFGPEDLPKFARGLGKFIASVRRISGEFTKEFGNISEAPEKVLLKAFDEPKANTAANKDKAVETFAEDGEDDEELLTYDPPAASPQNTENAGKPEADPLAGLPTEMVSYEKAEDPGEKVKDTSR